MIQSLRRRHRLTLRALAVALPVVLASALMARRTVPPSARLPLAHVSEATASGSSDAARRFAVEVNAGGLWKGQSVSARLVAADGWSQNLSFTSQPGREMNVPDALVYWAAAARQSDRLPDGAMLLGSLRGARSARFALPNIAHGNRLPSNDVRGHLILFSLAHRRVIAIADLTKGVAP